jgi:hypothetical protein
MQKTGKKIETKSHKINLALIDEAKKGQAMVLDAFNNAIWNSLGKLPNYAGEIVSEAKSVLAQASKGQAMAIENARKVSVMAKELGIPNPKEIDDIFKNNDYDSLASGFATDIDKIIQKVKANS